MNRLLFLLLILCSCEGFLQREVQVKGLPSQPLPLVVGVLNTADSLIRVRVAHAEPAVGEVKDDQRNYRPLRDAKLWIGNANQEVPLAFDETLEYYTLPVSAMPLEPGKEYHLRLLTAWGTEAQASCRIPEGQLDVSSLVVDYHQPDPYGLETASLGWRDIAGQRDFYHLHEYEYASEEGKLSLLSDEGFMPVSDENQPGGMLYTAPFALKPSGDYYHYYYRLYLADEHFYRFHQSLAEARLLNDDFFAEPFNLYSNVNGGLGVFAALHLQATFQLN